MRSWERSGRSARRRSLVDRWLGLGPATHRYDVEPGLVMTTPDGVELLATRYVPRGLARGPVVLIRTPYGRDDRWWNRTLPRPLAARGHQVVVQSVRGTFGSGGGFEPGRHETDDGLAAVAWLRAQPWCDGRVAMAGGSYVGLTQWAVGPYLDEPLTAMAVSVGASTMVGGWYPQGALALDQTLRWANLLTNQEKPLGPLRVLRGGRRISRALRSGAVRDADVAAFGSPEPGFRERIEYADDPRHWAGVVDHSDGRSELPTPTSMVTGWYDLFLRDQLADHRALVAAGRCSRMVIGPWSHASLGLIPYATRAALELLDQVHGADEGRSRAAVRLYVQGLGQWRDHESWPPPAEPRRLRLGASGEAGTDVVAIADSSHRLSYDPADPTPAIGGPTLGGPAGQQDQRTVERRRDVLTHTGPELDTPLEIVGVVTAHVPASVSAGGGLVVVRLCDVDRRGVSRNVTEGLARVRPGAEAAVLELDPTAYLFRAGHRIRVHVTAGAYPSLADPAGTPYEVTVHYSRQSGPYLTLPVTGPLSEDEPTAVDAQRSA